VANRRNYRINRQLRLIELVAAAGGPTKLMERTGVTDTHIIACVKGRRDVGDEMAAALEAGMDKPDDWMDTPPSPLQGGDAEQAHLMSLAPVVLPPELSWEATMKSDRLPPQFRVAMPDEALDGLPAGTILLFSCEEKPTIGAGVLVEDATGRRYVRRYAEGTGGRWLAQATRSAYLTLDSERDGLKLLAVMTGRMSGTV
jgi:hypothetical protein